MVPAMVSLSRTDAWCSVEAYRLFGRIDKPAERSL
jgi:hypothetical protein